MTDVPPIPNSLQQHLPFTVLKFWHYNVKATQFRVATVLTVYGIETTFLNLNKLMLSSYVATVLTVYGIETMLHGNQRSRGRYDLQQHLPFTVCAGGYEAVEAQ